VSFSFNGGFLPLSALVVLVIGGIRANYAIAKFLRRLGENE
jgi:hypothetical protein